MREWTILGYNIMNHLRYVHTVPERFCAPWKPYRIRLLFTHRNGCGGAISVTEQSCTAPISKAESHTRLVFVALRKASGGSRGGALRAAPLLIFRPNWGPKGQKKIWDPLPYLRVWMTGHPLISRSGSGNESYPVGSMNIALMTGTPGN